MGPPCRCAQPAYRRAGADPGPPRRPCSYARITRCTRSRALELLQDPAHVRLHGRFGQEEPRGELGVVEPLARSATRISCSRGVSAVEQRRPARRRLRRAGRSAANSSIIRRVTRGASAASPACTVRIAAVSSPGRTSFRRKPLAPARIAANAYSSRSKVVSTMTRGASGPAVTSAGGGDAVDTRHAHVHEHHVDGGSIVRARRPQHRPRPRRRRRGPGSASSTIRNPVRTSAWSSTMATRMPRGSSVMPRPRFAATQRRRARRQPPLDRGPASSVPPYSADPLAQARRGRGRRPSRPPRRAGGRRPRRPRCDRVAEVLGCARPRCWAPCGVPQGVRQALLH